jgi:hypothetical protein
MMIAFCAIAPSLLLRVRALKDYSRPNAVEFDTVSGLLAGKKGRFAILKDGSPSQETTLH